ncbi:alkanesulfonate monooxygenase [Acinetobacter sp. ANC 4558]|uniref:LLM class flavin-dependent oxidoreductase n=1 Tax=Acinetobacter sp. ANC 4558 TaxID=1977876 RepID=UPI000A3336AE|nr:LLM class flavin-dependent oxidoreductase [Acinetobacter sp. ANC 4558]OTG86814.1 alkanesulfonate monooxygenase [Acinetobacter sp. ANC 4558]
MTIQILGMIGHRKSSEIIPAQGSVFDADYVAAFAKAHEDAGFDRVLIGQWSDQPDGFIVAAHAGANTTRLKFLLAHRPGFIAPTLAARKYATLDHLLKGRLAIHVITGGSDHEQRRDGDFLNKVERYARTKEFLDVLKLSWTSKQPFQYQGKYYQVHDGFSEIKPVQSQIPVYFGGSSAEALNVAAEHADVFALWGEPLAGATELIQSIRLQELNFKRSNALNFNISFRPIIAETETQAWEKAQDIYQLTHAQIEKNKIRNDKKSAQSVGAERLVNLASQDVHDTNLWTGISTLVHGNHNSTALVGTPEQVASSIVEYYKLGIGSVLIRGFDPLNDVIEYGKALLPSIREKAAKVDTFNKTA